ncbi:elongation factor P [bacterium]|nr:elongation factor P [bacterium]
MPLTDQPVKGMYIREEGKIFFLVDRKLKTQGRQGGLIIMKMKALDKGTQIEKTIKAGTKIEYIQPETIEVQYLYSDDSSLYFMDTTSYETLSVSKKVVGDYIHFLKEGETCLVMKFEDNIINLKGNATVELEVVEATPAVRGNTANAATKNVKVETGFTLNVPLFIETGDVIKINTDTGNYSGKAN